MLGKNYLLLSALAVFLLSAWALPAAVIREVRVEAVDVHFNDRDFVLAVTQVRPGDQVDQRRISRDVKNLTATGRFSFVDSDLVPVGADYDLVYRVAVKPRLEKPVVVEGAEHIGERRIRKWLGLEPGNAVDDAVLSMRSRKVREEYHRRFYPDVKLAWEIITDPATGFARVIYRVQEGERATLRRVKFAGNTYQPPNWSKRFTAGLRREVAVSPESVPPERLQAVMQPRLWHIFSIFTKRGVYNPDDLEADRDALRALYLNRGYLDVQIDEPEVSYYHPRKLEAVYHITEGPQYRLGEINLRDHTIFADAELRALIKLRPGDIADMSAVNRTAETLRDYYLNRGYMRAGVQPRMRPRASGSVVDVDFMFHEGEIVNIRYVDIRGNARTKDHVIRRELTVYPGELYNMVKVRQSERILRNLGFFSQVSSYPHETIEAARDDLVFEVTEQPTGQFTLGAGYSSIDDIIGFVEVSQGNFDLFDWPRFTGGGQKLRLRAQVGSETEEYLMSLTEPWFLGRKLSLGGELYRTVRKNLSSYYNERRMGGAVTLGKPLRGFFHRANLRYGLEDINIYDVATNAVQRIQNEEGSRLVSSVKLSLIHDSRDNYFVPTRGVRLMLGGRVAGGPLAGDVDMYGLEADVSAFYPLWFGHVFNLRGRVDVVQEYGNDDDVRIFDRLFLGGARTLRGFKYRYVAPYEEGEPIGGKTLALLTAEYTVPITRKILRGVVFYDIGNVWMDAYEMDTTYCSDVGVGLRLDVPNFPIRLEYAWPLEICGDVERTGGRFNVWLGYGF